MKDLVYGPLLSQKQAKRKGLSKMTFETTERVCFGNTHA